MSMRIYVLTRVSPLTIVESLCRRHPDTVDSSAHDKQDCPDPFGHPEFHDEASLVRLGVVQESKGFGPKQMTLYPQQQK
jgi:hypothetical protein